MNFEELFNMELFGPSSSQSRQGSPSRAVSTSPSSAFFSLSPATPPIIQADAFNAMITDPNIDPSLYEQFTLPDPSFDEAIGMSAPNASLSDAGTSPASSTPYDFFGSYSGAASISSPDTPPSATFSPEKFDMNSMDPRLAVKPVVAPKAQPEEHRSRPEEDSDDSEDDGEDLIKPVKAGGKGKGRRGTVASGGVVKRTSSAVASASGPKDKNDDDWRPSPEEYKKMSSKEKRQLRNKISARNFRVRRKGGYHLYFTYALPLELIVSPRVHHHARRRRRRPRPPHRGNPGRTRIYQT
jgi:hypothetical protein